jgi:peroxiredoxin family protein
MSKDKDASSGEKNFVSTPKTLELKVERESQKFFACKVTTHVIGLKERQTDQNNDGEN